MTAAAVPARAAHPVAGHPDVAVARRALRQLRNGALVIGLSFGATAAASATSYVASFPTAADRARIARSIGGDAAFAVLFGRVDRIGTVGGYTAYKSYLLIATVGAIWAGLAATRLLRGEEDGGRWQLVLSGRTTAARATVATLAALAGAVALVGLGTAVPMALAGRKAGVDTSLTDAVVLGCSALVAPLAFAAVGAVCSQLARTRRIANSCTMGVLAVAFVVRMVADSGPGTAWLLWATPFGWAELVRPFTGNDLWPLVPTAALAVVGAVVAVRLVGARDTGGGVLAGSDVAPPRAAGLGSPLGLAARLGLPVLSAWAVGVAATGFVMGMVAKPAAAAIADSSGASSTLAKLGGGGTGSSAYLGVVFLLVGAVVALVPASQVGAAADEELSGRLGQLLAGRTTRARWLLGRIGLTAGVVAAVGGLAGLATWAGAASQGVDVRVGPLLGAGANVVPAALVALGVGTLALAVAPRAAGTVVYAVVGWSFTVDLLGQLVSGLDPIARLSLFHYVALAPAEGPDRVAVGALLAVAAALVATATVLLERRDLARD